MWDVSHLWRVLLWSGGALLVVIKQALITIGGGFQMLNIPADKTLPSCGISVEPLPRSEPRSDPGGPGPVEDRLLPGESAEHPLRR